MDINKIKQHLQDVSVDIEIPNSLIPELDIIMRDGSEADKRRIGRGGSGNVYRLTMDGRYVAVKQLTAINNPSSFTRMTNNIDEIGFVNEVRNMARLWNRGGIATFLGVVLSNPVSIVMEYISGGTLYDFIKEHGINIGIEGKRIILLDIAKALDLCHRAGIIHSDIKTTNILMDHNHMPKICDFGVSISGHKDFASRSFGTDSWVAPERYAGDAPSYKPPTHASDVYSFGVLCCHVLMNVGKSPACFAESDLNGGHPREFWGLAKQCMSDISTRIPLDAVIRALESMDYSKEQLDVIDSIDSFDRCNISLELMCRMNNKSAQGYMVYFLIMSDQSNYAARWAKTCDYIRKFGDEPFVRKLLSTDNDGVTTQLLNKYKSITLNYDVDFDVFRNNNSIKRAVIDHIPYRDVFNHLTHLSIHRQKPHFLHKIHIKTLEYLDISYNELSSEHCGDVLAILTHNQHLAHLIISHNNFDQQSCKSIVGVRDLATADISYNRITDICDLTRIRVLNVEKNCIDGNHLRISFDDFMVQDLNISFNHLGDNGAVAISLILHGTNTLEKLDISNNVIGREGSEKIIDSLAQNTSLTHLDISSNNVCSMEKWLDMLEKNHRITYLNLQFCNLQKADDVIIPSHIGIDF